MLCFFANVSKCALETPGLRFSKSKRRSLLVFGGLVSGDMSTGTSVAIEYLTGSPNDRSLQIETSIVSSLKFLPCVPTTSKFLSTVAGADEAPRPVDPGALLG